MVQTGGSPSVLGDIVLASGPGARPWLETLAGFTMITETDEAIQVATRGAARHGRGQAGSWAAVADLVAGSPEEALATLDKGAPQRRFRGRFACVAWSSAARRVAATTDHFSTVLLYVLVHDGVVALATDLRLLASSPFCRRQIDLDSVYHYLNFAHIPAPGSIFKDIRRLEPSTVWSWEDGRTSETRYYVPEYPADARGSEAALASEMRDRMVDTVNAYRPPDGQSWGCFLSGGTDSSSITSILSRAGRVKTFSIGFSEEDFDELSYARLAARECGADPVFHSVSEADALGLASRITDAYDQPFGGTSSIPTLACVEVAAQRGVDLLVAGDGGDEIFGGNEHYAKDRIMEAWYGMPRVVRDVALAAGRVAARSGTHFFNRVENFFERASLANPDRFYSDASFASDHYDQLLSADFRKAVGRDASLEWLRRVYRLGQSGGPLHKVMRIDLLHTIAMHDIRKVDNAARFARVSVRFPYLDPELVDWVNRLPERYKVRGLTKRYLFRRATRDILPEAILKKKKQGFGVPIREWMRKPGAFQTLVTDTLFDSRARGRGWLEVDYLAKLLDEHKRGGWDHSDYLWRVLMLEMWLRRYVDAA